MTLNRGIPEFAIKKTIYMYMYMFITIGYKIKEFKLYQLHIKRSWKGYYHIRDGIKHRINSQISLRLE